MNAELTQTVAVLAAALVFVMKWGIEMAGRKKNGPNTQQMISDVHKWLSPVADQSTGQSRFPWFCSNAGIKEEMELLRKSIEDLKEIIEELLKSRNGL